MKQLVENGVVNEIKKLKNKKKITQREKHEERKREILENHGLPIDFTDEEEAKKDNKKKDNEKISNKENTKNSETNNVNHANNTNNNNNALNKKFMSKTTRGFYPKNNNFFSLEYNNTNNDKKKIPLRSKKLKPSINQFEYIERINDEKKKLNYNSDNSPRHTNINHSKNIFVKGKTKSANMELNDSFRQKFSKNMNNHNNNFCQNMKFKNKSCNNDIIQKSIEDFQDEFPFSHKKNYRSSEEIRKFVKDKKLKNKKKEDEILLEKNKKLFLLFKNLYNLNMKDFSKATPSVTTEHFYIRSPNIPTISSRGKGVMPSRSSNNYTNSSKNETNNSHNKLRKKKEINEYYIGNDSTLKNNNSTLVDPNEYYLNVLESQQLFVNSALNKIENDSVNSENDNELNVSKEQIQKIISKESKINNSSGKKNNNLILNTNEYNDFKKKN